MEILEILVLLEFDEEAEHAIGNALYREIQRLLPKRHDALIRPELKKLVKATNRYKNCQRWKFHPVYGLDYMGLVSSSDWD